VTAPEVSVVCSTYNRATRVPALVAALEAQTLAPSRFEVVIVDNGSADDTSEVLAKLASNSPLDIRVERLPVNRGAGGGRNAGWRAAQGRVVAFTDDDCAPQPRWLEEGLARIAATGAGIVVGRTQPNPAQKQNDGPFSRTARVSEESGTRYMPTCNVFYLRADLATVDGFDENFATKGGEDTDLGWRVLDLGRDVAWAEDALVLHDIGVGGFRSAVREAAYWYDIPRVTAKHPVRARPILWHRLFCKQTHELVLLGVAGGVAAVALRNPIPLLASIPWLRYRYRNHPIVKGGRKTRISYLPHAFVIDAVEVAAMIRGSVRNRTFVL
jgi:glycosyltransferase involved in cell wall biosynthesis